MLKQKMLDDLKIAMKAKEEMRISTLRMVSAAIKNKEIAKRATTPSSDGASAKELTDEEILAVIGTEVKRRGDAIQQYTAGNRPDLAEKEQKEKTILESYLPAQLSDEELDSLVDAAIKESNASSEKDFGAVMKALMPKVKGKAQGNRVSDTVRQRLIKNK